MVASHSHLHQTAHPESESLIRHFEALTRHRDISLLNRSIIDSLTSLLGLKSTHLYDIIEQDGSYFCALAAWSENGSVILNENFPSKDQLEGIEAHPVMDACLKDPGHISSTSSLNENIQYVAVRPDEKPIAIFELKRKAPFSSAEITMADGIINVYRNYLSLLKDSQHDTLTGLLNRRTFDHGLTALLSSIADAPTTKSQHMKNRRIAHADTYWLAIIDIDHFKAINDRFGHLYGDEVLILMANLMRKSFRQHDRIYRFGGEEFVVLMRHVDFNNAQRKLEKFRTIVAGHPFPQVGHVSVTIGCAQLMASDTPAIVLGNADEALYWGKSNGRNQVNFHSELIAHGLLPVKQFHMDAELF